MYCLGGVVISAAAGESSWIEVVKTKQGQTRSLLLRSESAFHNWLPTINKLSSRFWSGRNQGWSDQISVTGSSFESANMAQQSSRQHENGRLYCKDSCLSIDRWIHTWVWHWAIQSGNIVASFLLGSIARLFNVLVRGESRVGLGWWIAKCIWEWRIEISPERTW